MLEVGFIGGVAHEGVFVGDVLLFGLHDFGGERLLDEVLFILTDSTLNHVVLLVVEAEPRLGNVLSVLLVGCLMASLQFGKELGRKYFFFWFKLRKLGVFVWLEVMSSYQKNTESWTGSGRSSF